jgi:hypothetical protein
MHRDRELAASRFRQILGECGEILGVKIVDGKIPGDRRADLRAGRHGGQHNRHSGRECRESRLGQGEAPMSDGRREVRRRQETIRSKPERHQSRNQLITHHRTRARLPRFGHPKHSLKL